MQQKIRIVKDSYSHVTRHSDPTEEYDGDDIVNEHSISGFAPVDDKDYYDFILDDYDPTEDKAYYLIYVLYDTGDSFHREDNVICLVECVGDRHTAETIAKAINKDALNGGMGPIVLTIDGKKYSIGCSEWKGYFEHFRSANVERIQRELL
jgi:hypothetical protein